jgi:phosphoglycerol transferase MdoB-like AlkP superfamily enzyme
VSRSVSTPQSHVGDRNLKLLPWLDASRFVLPWFVPAVFSIALKLSELGHDRGFRVVARFLGRIEGTGDTGLSLGERLTFFRSDILFAFLLIPPTLWILFRYLPRLWCAIAAAGIACLLSLALFIQYRSLEEMGQYVSLPILRVALIWAWHDPAANAGYLFTREFGAFLAGIFMIALLTAYAWKRSKKNETSPRNLQKWKIAGIFYAACVLVVGGPAWRPLLPATAYHRNVMAQTLEALWQKPQVDTTEFASLSRVQLVQRYRDLTGAPAPLESSEYAGRERGANVIFFLLETTPARFLPPEDSLTEFPNLKLLEEHSFVARQHYSVYPYTNRAVPSIFSSWYPSDGLSTFSEEHSGAALPGFAPVLAGLGYATAIYLPSPLHGGDLDTFRSLGFEREVFPDPAALSQFAPPGLAPAWKAERIARDRAVLNLLKQDVETWLSAGHPFAVAFVPQIGHLPWPDAETGSSAADIQRRGRAIIASEDEWLGELLAILGRHHQLENTVIVITGDHGIRTSHEDPNFVGGKIDEYSFHVPLYIYAPRAVSQPVVIPWLTSHIDLTPTVLDLLGADRNRDAEQGAPIWNPAISRRTTFFFSRQAFGADGYYADRKFFTSSQMSGAASANSEMHFWASNVLRENSAESNEVTRQIERMIALDEAWDTQFSPRKQ